MTVASLEAKMLGTSEPTRGHGSKLAAQSGVEPITTGEIRVFLSSEANELGLAASWRAPLAETIPLSLLAAAVDSGATQRVDMATIWRGLVDGELKIVDTFFTAQRCGLVVSRGHDPQALQGRRRVILETILRGRGQKRVAIEMQLAASTVAISARAALRQLGVSTLPSRVHPMLALAASASELSSPSACANESLLLSEDREHRVIGMPRPELALVGRMPRAELEVLSRVVEGVPHVDIARARRTSVRTTANQVAALFRRFGVSGRSELLQALFEAGGAIARPRDDAQRQGLLRGLRSVTSLATGSAPGTASAG